MLPFYRISSFSDYSGHMENQDIRNSESGTRCGTGTGTGTGTGQINGCVKLGIVIDISTPAPFSAFLARWMMILGVLLRKGTSTKDIGVIRV